MTRLKQAGARIADAATVYGEADVVARSAELRLK